MKIKFLYHAEAVGATGYITLPVRETMEIQASVALPINGGHGAARVENCHHRNYFSFRVAESHVSGAYSAKDRAYESLATTTIERINILDVVTCDRVIARLTSKYPEDGSEPSFVPLGSRFENLRIAGHKIEVGMATVRSPNTIPGRNSRKPTPLKKRFKRTWYGLGPVHPRLTGFRAQTGCFPAHWREAWTGYPRG